MSLVLWGPGLEESAAVIFVTELRRAGLPVKVVSLRRQAARGAFGLGLLPDLSLEEAEGYFPQVCCLILPGPVERLALFSQHPRLEELLAAVAERGIFVAAASPVGSQQTERADGPTPAAPSIYPGDERLPVFARELAEELMGAGSSTERLEGF